MDFLNIYLVKLFQTNINYLASTAKNNILNSDKIIAVAPQTTFLSKMCWNYYRGKLEFNCFVNTDSLFIKSINEISKIASTSGSGLKVWALRSPRKE